MKLKYLIFVVLFVISISGCVSSQQETQQRQIILERFDPDSLPQYQNQKFIITNSSIVFETYNQQDNRTGVSNTSIETERFEELIEDFSQFNSLEESYKLDDYNSNNGYGNITFVNDTTNNTVTINPYTSQENPEEIASIITSLNSFIDNNLNQK